MTNKYRVHTVQFAVPSDDPTFTLTELRDQIQETLYDQEGWSGSFQIIGTMDQVSGTGMADDHFQRMALDLGAIKANADEKLRLEALAERTAKAWGWEVLENDPNGEVGRCLFNNNLDRIRDPWDWVGACADIDVVPGQFPVRFSVDGYTHDDPESMLDGDGQFGPFSIFDSDRQDYTFGQWDDRAEAQAVADKMNADYQRRMAAGFKEKPAA